MLGSLIRKIAPILGGRIFTQPCKTVAYFRYSNNKFASHLWQTCRTFTSQTKSRGGNKTPSGVSVLEGEEEESSESNTTKASQDTSSSSTTLSPDPISYHDVLDAYRRINTLVKKTPLDHSPHLSKACQADVFLKKEHISITGSYKERGALNKLLMLTDEERKRGVICSSAGNHAQAVSYHATRLRINNVIVMPENTPVVKVEATRSFGGKVLLSGSSFAEAYLAAQKIAEEENRIFIHAFNDPAIVAGQGTVAMEMLEQNPYLDAVIVPVGGGGLIAGMGCVFKHVNPRIKVYGVEAKAMPGMFKSFKNGMLASVPRNPTMADGIAIENVGPIPFHIIKNVMDDIVLVDEDEIATSILTLMEKEKTVVEGSGATGLAALLFNKLNLKNQNVGIVLTGGNIDLSLLGRIIDKGLVKKGRLCRISVTIPDVPGSLATACGICAAQRANIREVEHERAFLIDHVGYTQPVFTLETRGRDHIHDILKAFHEAGFTSAAVMNKE